MNCYTALLCLSMIAFRAVSAASVKPKYVEFDIARYFKQEDLHSCPSSNSAVNSSVANRDYYYQITIGIGTPPQFVDFTLDTGSSDLWVFSADNPALLGTKNGINTESSAIAFNSNISSTFHKLDVPFEIYYGDRTYAAGSLVTDNLDIGGMKINNATFALATTGNSSTGVFGIGFTQNESEAKYKESESSPHPTYLNVPALMKHEGLIHSNTYSLWLNDVKANIGSILFGAVDRSKYCGQMMLVPFYNNYQNYSEHPTQARIMLNGIKLDNELQIDMNIAVLIDSGTSLAYLPEYVVASIGSQIGFEYDYVTQFYIGNATAALKKINTVQLNFSGAIINVALKDLLISLSYVEGLSDDMTVGPNDIAMLALGIAKEEYQYILGDAFMRSMYAVFDLDNYQFGLAQAKYTSAKPDIVPVIASIPNAIAAPGYANTIVDTFMTAYDPRSKTHSPSTSTLVNRPMQTPNGMFNSTQ